LGLSLAAAALTAVSVAAISVAADNGGGDKAEKGRDEGATRVHHVLPGPPDLSEEDEAKLEEFRQCMEDNGAPAPPAPGEMRERLKDGDIPKPPSEAEIRKLEQAYEACKDKLPEGAEFGFHHGGPGGCNEPGGPPPGVQEGTAIPAPPSGGSQGDVEQVPQVSTS
jgi:hypothetical protein